jgi:hypothetical protein
VYALCAACLAVEFFFTGDGICAFVNGCIEGDKIHPKKDYIVDPNGDKGGTCHY